MAVIGTIAALRGIGFIEWQGTKSCYSFRLYTQYGILSVVID
jgi:hypothetical protein